MYMVLVCCLLFFFFCLTAFFLPLVLLLLNSFENTNRKITLWFSFLDKFFSKKRFIYLFSAYSELFGGENHLCFKQEIFHVGSTLRCWAGISSAVLRNSKGQHLMSACSRVQGLQALLAATAAAGSPVAPGSSCVHRVFVLCFAKECVPPLWNCFRNYLWEVAREVLPWDFLPLREVTRPKCSAPSLWACLPVFARAGLLADL